MALGQLYYTSCRTGITGYPGYQFNAVTPGIPLDVMRDVEGLTAYEPPRSLTAAGVDLDRYPVNLCHLPGDTTVVASVEFVGEDYSRRSGNYFAHALVAADPEHDLAGCRPIELWRSHGWVTEPVEHADLPELPQPPSPGPLTPQLVGDSLTGGGNDHHLGAMLTAAEAAIQRGERKLVIIADDCDTVAHWIAALTYLLPPALARQMSFMTYSRQPRYSRTTVVGALPEVDIERTADGFESYYLFDLSADRASDLTVHPLARLLAEVGPAAGPMLWERAERHATGTERDFDDLYPIAVAATVGWSEGPLEPELDPLPLIDWLHRNAATLDPDLFTAVGDAATAALREAAGRPGGPGPETVVEQLGRLAEAADGRGLPQLVPQIEVALVGTMLAADTRPPKDLALRSEIGRRNATDQLTQRLLGMPVDSAGAYLLWARRIGLKLDNAALLRVGTQTIGPALLAGGGSEVLDVMRAWLPVREGAIRHLAIVAGKDPDPVIALIAARSGDLELDDNDLDASPALAEAVVLADVRVGRVRPVEALLTLTAARRAQGLEPAVDEDLLQRLWPTDGFTCGQALAVLDRLHEHDLADPCVVDRLGAAAQLQPPLDERAAYDLHTDLVNRLAESAVFGDLPPKARKHIQELRLADTAAGRVVGASSTARFEDAFEELRGLLTGRSATAARRQRVEDELLRQHKRINLTRLLIPIRRLPNLRQRLVAELAGEAGRVDLEAAATLWYWHYELGRDPDAAARNALDDIDKALLPVLKGWRRRDLQSLSEQLRDMRALGSAHTLQTWMDGDGSGLLRKIARTVVGRTVGGKGGRPDKSGKKD
ncbi:GTPase-associated protein 1-related protein [Dactylosporangium sp. NBC_01737]|uniref:GTPase-associated protein 1-related protein n=1 Tax=Dactylosporangium sp. NBC_01737 TaxID=2975959 RepID=UPI002E13E624|nr:GTPase-associated protein 1-related protein [Dactylosporangium sp. NBC_01737]